MYVQQLSLPLNYRGEPRRFAGYRLAGQPLEYMRGDELREPLEKIQAAFDRVSKAKAGLKDMTKSIPISPQDPLSPSAGLSIYEGYDGGLPGISGDDYLLANKQQLNQIADEFTGNVLNLAWGTHPGHVIKGEYPQGPRQYSARKEDAMLAAAARDGWDEMIAQIPDGTILRNQPAGVEENDFTRADLYMSGGMGPLQSDGSQYGIMRSGKLYPISPFDLDVGHARHLLDRAKKGGLDTFIEPLEKQVDFLLDYNSDVTLDLPEGTNIAHAKGFQGFDGYAYDEPTPVDLIRQARRDRDSTYPTHPHIGQIPRNLPEGEARDYYDQQIDNYLRDAERGEAAYDAGAVEESLANMLRPMELRRRYEPVELAWEDIPF